MANTKYLTSFILIGLLFLSACSLSNEQIKEKITSKMAENDNYKLTYEIKLSGEDGSSFLVLMKSGDIKKTQFETLGLVGVGSNFLTNYQKGDDSVLCMKTVFNTDELIKQIAGDQEIPEEDDEFVNMLFWENMDIGFCSPYGNNGKDVVTALLLGSFLQDEEIVISKKEVNGEKAYCGSQTTDGNIFEYKEETIQYLTYNEICLNPDTAFVVSLHSKITNVETQEAVSDVTMNLIKEETITRNDITNNKKFLMENFKCTKNQVSFDVFSLSDFTDVDLIVNKTKSGDNSVVYSGKDSVAFFENKSYSLDLQNPVVGSVGLNVCFNGICERGFCQVQKECIDQDLKSYQETRNLRESPEWTKSFAELRGEKIYDKCIDSTTISEAICDENDELATNEFECQCGCSDGACGYQPKIDFNFEKRISKDLGNNHAMWQIKASVLNPNEIEKIDLKNLELWVTKDLNPKNMTDIKKTFEVNKILQPNEAYESEAWEFEYTIGSSNEYPSPIVWMQPMWCGLYD